MILDVMDQAIAEPRARRQAELRRRSCLSRSRSTRSARSSVPKGKVINTLQQETGADIAVDDDGIVGTVTIGAKDGRAVEEARRRIELILDPPTAEVGATYQGRS